jgi:hypothetical protein
MTRKAGIWDLISGEVSLMNNSAQNEDITTQTR